MLFKNKEYKPTQRFATISTLFLLLVLLPGCAGYQNSPGKWVNINTSSIFFSGIELKDKAITSGYDATCKEAVQEIEKALIRELPAKISPLVLRTADNPPDKNDKAAELKLLITQCDIDSDQSGGSFSYYLTLPLRVTLTLNGEILLDYPIQTYEQIQVSVPSPLYEFTFAEAENRILLLFNGSQVWLPNASAAE